MEKLRERYTAQNQAHVLKYYDFLDDKDKQALLRQLELIEPEKLNSITKKALEGPGADSQPANIAPVPGSSCESLFSASADQLSKWSQHGLDLIQRGKVAVLLLAGGQGTRLGTNAPKGCYDIGIPSHKSLFQLQAERLAKVTSLAKAERPIPWYIMTSGPTRKATEQFFAEHNYFNLEVSSVVFFEQGTMPCVDFEGKILLESKSKVALAPDGNGGIYNALHKQGILDDMKSRGIEHVHAYCVDNCLVKVADPVFLGFAATKEVEIASKVVRKRDPNESVGLVVSRNGKPAVIEYTEISRELAGSQDLNDSSLLMFRAANIVNHYYSMDFLCNSQLWDASVLPYHIAKKKIPHIDVKTDQADPSPKKPNGIKFEQFIFDVFPKVSFDKFAVLEVPRQSEFSPLKNAPGSSQDSPETSRRDLLAQSMGWLTKVGATFAKDVQVEVSPLTSYAGEGLDKYSKVHFERSTIL